MKALIFDSGPLINFSMNGLLSILEELKNKFDGKFIITKQVKYETVDRPLNIKKYEWGALRVKNLIEKGVLEFPESLGISENELNNRTKDLMTQINHNFKVENNWVHLVDEAEVSCVALSNLLNKKGIKSIIAIDERTTRMLLEKPENLKILMSEKLNKKVEIMNEIPDRNACKFIRSAELIYTAYKKGLIDVKDKRVLEALLYATKFRGCSISFEEIDVLKRL